jgi:hypothetical protein
MRKQLLCCNQGGNPNRNSDPLISKQAYAQVLGEFHYTLANPVGLYIAAIEQESLLLPDNNTPVPAEWWKEVRGSGFVYARREPGAATRARVPPSEKLPSATS